MTLPGKQLLPVGMLVVLDSIFNRIIRNRALGKNTWVYIDLDSEKFIG